MPLGKFEREVMQLIACNRNPQSFVAGASVLHQQPESPRTSLDIDLFHDSETALKSASEADIESLRTTGYDLHFELKTNTLIRGAVSKGSSQTKVDWPFRFFPAEKDPDMGWRINFWDGATNKILALFNRHEFRDYFDIVYLHEQHLHLAALVWAAAGKDPGLTPEFILDWLKRSTRYGEEEVSMVRLQAPRDMKEMKQVFLQACEEAERLFKELPMEDIGCLYLGPERNPVLPNPKAPNFGILKRHFASLGGSLP